MPLYKYQQERQSRQIIIIMDTTTTTTSVAAPAAADIVNHCLLADKYQHSNVFLVHKENASSKFRGQLSKNIQMLFGKWKKNNNNNNNNNNVILNDDKLGTIEISIGKPNIVTFFSQFMYGTSEGPHQLVNDKYDNARVMTGKKQDTKENRKKYFQSCLQALENEIMFRRKDDDNNNNNNIKILFPYRIACGLSGGKWEDYRSMINQFAQKMKTINVNVHIIKHYNKCNYCMRDDCDYCRRDKCDYCIMQFKK